MIVSALVEQYEALAAKGEIAHPGWGTAKISFGLELRANGEIRGLYPLTEPDDKGKLRPQNRLLPALSGAKGNGIKSTFLWGTSDYFLGFSGKTKPERVAKCFAAAKELHLSLLEGVDDPFAQAVCAFFNNWDTEAAQEHPLIAEFVEALEAGGNLVLLYDMTFPGDSPAISKAWQNHYDGDEASEAQELTMRCLVTGQESIPEAIHPSVKNVRGAQSSGAALVSFNAASFCSYGREQNLNAPMSKYAAFAYTTALNHLLSDREYVQYIGDATVVYWAEGAADQEREAFHALQRGEETDAVGTEELRQILEKVAAGEEVEWNGLPLRPKNRFYVLGLSPNAARVSVRLFLQSTFGSISQNLLCHYRDMEIVRPAFEKWSNIPLWAVLRETVNPNARDKNASPQMAGDTLRAILTGGRYPETLYQAVQLRIRADRNINYLRAAIIKAYLKRNTNLDICKEESMVQLNEETTYQPYVLGRLFSVLEAIQDTANPGINATIKDKYFSSACAAPAMVFPRLLDLAGKHLRKIDPKFRTHYAKQLGALTAPLTESFAIHHTLHDQGIFQLGYYHQTQKRYEKKSEPEGSANNKNEEEMKHV